MTITAQLDLASPYWPYPGVATVHALVSALGLQGQPVTQQAQAIRQFMQTPAWETAPPVLQRDVSRWLGLLFESQAEFSVTGQAVGLAADVTVAPEAMQPPGLPVPDDPAAVSMFTAHRVDDTLNALAHATERMQAARATGDPELRAYHAGHIAAHLQFALDACHDLAANLREHYPPEAAELDAVADTVGLAKAVSSDAKAATTAHLLETTLHELTHGIRHAKQMLTDPPGAEAEFDADHCEKHLGGAVEHADKLAQHLRDNYPAEAKWLNGLDEITAGAEEDSGKQDDGPQHARYAGSKGTVSAQLANLDTISGQLG